jgi:hypothetical protein
MKTMTVKLRGIAPLYLHNNQTVDPLNEFARAIKKISGKRSKTDADFEKMSQLEFMAGLYMGDKGPVIPSKMLHACFVEGSKKSKHGKLAKAGVFFPSHSPIKYKGTKDPEKMYAAGFVSRDPVKVQRNTIIRTRPRFEEWGIDVEVEYEPSVMSKEDVVLAWENAGKYCGLGDWRPQNGRFVVEE